VLTPQLLNNQDINNPSIQQNSIKIIQTSLHQDKLIFKLNEHNNLEKDTLLNTKKINMTKIELLDEHDNQIEGSESIQNPDFNKNYSFNFKKQALGKKVTYDNYHLSISYKMPNGSVIKDNKPLKLPLHIEFTNYDIQKLTIKNVSVKQTGYKKAKITFDMNEISEGINTRDVKATRVFIKDGDNNTIKTFNGNNLSFGTNELSFKQEVGNYSGYTIDIEYGDAKYTASFDKLKTAHSDVIQTFVIEAR